MTSSHNFRKFFLLTTIFIIGFSSSSCKRKPSISFRGTSPGITDLEEGKKPDPVHIYFDGSAAPLEQVDKVVKANISISPTIPGEWRWVSDRLLTFTPGEDWAVGETYDVNFKKQLFPKHVRLKEYSYRFETPKFNGTVEEARFYLHPKNPNIKKIVSTIKFTHPVDTAEFEKHIKVEESGLVFIRKAIPFSVSYNKHKTEAYLHIHIAEIPKKDTSAWIKIEKGFGSSRGGKPTEVPIEHQVTVPGIFSVFRVRDAKLTLVRNERYEPEQVFILEFTNGALEKDVQSSFEAYVLPVDLPPVQGRAGSKNYHWSDVRIIGPEILSKSEKLKLTPLPTASEYAELHSFKYTADVNRYVYVKVNKGATSYGGYILADNYDRTLRVPTFPKELNIMHDGAVLSLSGDRKLSILSRGIDAFRFQVERVLPYQVNHLVTQAGGQFKNPRFSNYNFDEKNIAERFIEERTLELVGPGKTQYSSFDFSSYISNMGSNRQMGLFFFKVESWDPVNKRPMGEEDSRLIMITDLGILVKDSNDQTHDVFVQSINNGHPVGDATVEVLGKNGVPVATQVTNETGKASFPSFYGMTDHKEPSVYLVRKGQDISFIPYAWSDRRINFSRFDVGGAVTQANQEGLTAFLFSDRGLYRPGETFKIGMIVKSFNWNDDIKGIPLEATIQDARGTEIYKTRLRLEQEGFEELSYTTEEVSPTGQYQVTLYTVKDNQRWNDLGSLALRVEEFEPDRMRISTRFSADPGAGWVSPEDLKGIVTLNTLFGQPASDRRVAAEITLMPTYPSFRQYSDYTFFDPLRAKREFTERLEDAQTDGKGEAEFNLKLERFEKATYRVLFAARGFEAAGGRSVASDSSILVSPLEYLIGFKSDGNLRYMSKDSERSVRIIAIGPDLKQKQVPNLQLQLLNQKYVSVLMRQDDGTYKYESVLKESPVWQKELTVPQNGMDYSLPTKEPGDYVLVLKDAELNELNRIPFSVVGSANLTMNLDKNAELQIKLDKSDYNPGEEIELQIVSPYVGAGLITIERDRVYQHKWFRAEKTSTVQRIRVPENLEGNAYVNVSFVRDIASEEIFMSPLSYGVAPFSISRRKRTNEITINCAELARPGEEFKIKYKTEQAGKIVVYAVDEGILQVAGYKLPDPLSFFFRKRALEVRTLQILDLILPEFRLVKALSAPGGSDEAGFDAIGKNLNPFRRKRDKAVVYWSGLLPTDTTEREVSFTVPDYFDGTLRVMAVAVAKGTIGTFEKKSVIRGHFVLTPNVPAFVAPGDELDIPVAVANNVEGSGKKAEVRVTFSPTDQFEIIGEKEKVITVPESQEKSVTFRVKVKAKLGEGSLQFVASRENKSSRRNVSLSIRPPVPYVTSFKAGHFKDKTVKVETPRKMYPHYRILEAAVSPLPLIVARGLWTYLDNYPYLETAALVSRAASAMALADIPEMALPSNTLRTALDNAFRILMARQNSEGAFGYWAANSHASQYESVFAIHFLTEAAQRGHPVPPQLLTKGIAYLRNLAGSYTNQLDSLRLRSYAVYVLTRNGIVTTNYLPTLRTLLEKNHEKVWMKDLAGIYLAASYKLMKQDDEADKIIRHAKLTEDTGDLIRDSQLLMILSLHFPDRLTGLKPEQLTSIVDPVSNGYYDLISSAYVIWGLSSYAKRVGPLEPKTVTITEVAGNGSKKKLAVPKAIFAKAPFSGEAASVIYDSDVPTPLFYNVTQAGFELTPPAAPMKNKLEVYREFQNDGGDTITKAKLGDEIEVKIRVRTIDNSGSSSVVVVDLFPAGFELVQDSIRKVNLETPYTSTERDSNQTTSHSEESYSGDGGEGGEGGEGYEGGEGNEGESHQESNTSDTPSGEDSGPSMPNWISYVDAREDRVVVFGTAGSDMNEFTYRLKATNRGTFSVPPIFAESTRNRNIQALSLGGQMTISD